MKGEIRIFGLLTVLLLLAAVACVAWTYPRWERTPPVVAVTPDGTALGRNSALQVAVNDGGTGLKHVSIRLRQGGSETVVADESVDPGEASRTYDVGRVLEEKGGLSEGPATLEVEVSDRSLWHFGSGNRTDLTKDLVVDRTPPRLEVLSSQHYINQGGSECIVYRVSDDAAVSGVQVGPHFFPGVHHDGSMFALFGFAYDLPATTPVQVVARDAAGNESVVGVQAKVFPKTFRSREIVLDDGFLNKVVSEIMSHTPSVQDQGDLVKNYVEINSKLRRENHASIAKLSEASADHFLWHGAFVQLSNSQVEAVFADHRTYTYKGEKVDQQDHVGFDLSVVQQTPIEAGNDGVVLFAGYFGIYGNAVMIDHGVGLVSLYGHMSAIDVQPGQTVAKGEIIGRSGATGLAGGDHLHFGLFLRGVPVNPNEWWDAHWINDHVLSRLGGA